MGTTLSDRNFSAKISQPPWLPFPSAKTREKPFDSIVTTLQNKNLLAPFSRHSSLNCLPPSSHPLLHLDSQVSLQQASSPARRQPRLSTPNLTHLEKPLPRSTMTHLSLPPSSSTKMSKDLDSIANQHRPISKSSFYSAPSHLAEYAMAIRFLAYLMQFII